MPEFKVLYRGQPSKRRSDPATVFKYIVSIDSTRLGFSKVTGLGWENKMVTKETGDNYASVLHFPGPTESNIITLEKGAILSPKTEDLVLVDWASRTYHLEAATDNLPPKELRKDVEIKVMNPRGVYWIRRYKCMKCFPTKYTASDLDASSSDIFIEKLELATDGIVTYYQQ